MNLGDLADVAQIVSAVAVLVSLIYLAIQIRQNTASVRSASFQELLNHIAQLNLLVLEDPTLAELFLEAQRRDLDPGTPDGLRLRFMFVTRFNHWFHAYSQHREGTITPEQWKVAAGGVRRMGRSPALQSAWRAFRDNYPEDFQRYMDAEIESSR